MNSHYRDLLEACKKLTATNVCHCNTECEKETGEYPPAKNAKNAWGEPVWGNEVCVYCQARFAVAKAEAEPSLEELLSDGPTLPVPRLQLLWVSGEPDDKGMVEEKCLYLMVYEVDKYDRRNLNDVESSLKAFTAVKLGETACSGGVRPDPLDTPYADGAHIQWDAKRLGWPAFVTRGKMVRQLKI